MPRPFPFRKRRRLASRLPVVGSAALRAADGEGPFGGLSDVVVGAVDKVVELRWDHARAAAAATRGTVDERTDQLTARFTKEMATVGAVTGGAGAVPGVGTAAVIGTSVAEIGWFTARAADLILTIAAVHGHTYATVEQRRGWVLSVLAFGDSASASFTQAAQQIGKGLGKRATDSVPSQLLRRVNRKVGTKILTKYGSKRGAIALGHALPFGIGAVIGGSANWAFARSVAKHADKFFRELPAALEASVAPFPAVTPAPVDELPPTTVG